MSPRRVACGQARPTVSQPASAPTSRPTNSAWRRRGRLSVARRLSPGPARPRSGRRVPAGRARRLRHRDPPAALAGQGWRCDGGGGRTRPSASLLPSLLASRGRIWRASVATRMSPARHSGNICRAPGRRVYAARADRAAHAPTARRLVRRPERCYTLFIESTTQYRRASDAVGLPLAAGARSGPPGRRAGASVPVAGGRSVRRVREQRGARMMADRADRMFDRTAQINGCSRALRESGLTGDSSRSPSGPPRGRAAGWPRA